MKHNNTLVKGFISTKANRGSNSPRPVEKIGYPKPDTAATGGQVRSRRYPPGTPTPIFDLLDLY